MTIAPAPVSRLHPCPCGSGKRYRDCHGALPVTAAARRSGYRPSGPDWDLVSEADRDRLGRLMETALVHQREGRAREAESCYCEVLAAAPRTHDALHMLGMVRWSGGDFLDARHLIEQALLLRPEYPSIRQNLTLVRAAQCARERSVQDAWCEKALPMLFDLPASPGTPADGAGRAPNADAGDATIHLIGVDDGSDADDAWMLRRLAVLLAPLRPVVWAARGGNPAVPEGPSITIPDAGAGRIPCGGKQVFAGVDADCSVWLARSLPRRAFVFPQSASPARLLRTLREIAAAGARPPELIAESRTKAQRFGAGHVVLPPPIDLGAVAAKHPRASRSESFVIGNVVQDRRIVESVPSGSLLECVAARGCELRLYDPGRARYLLGPARNVQCVSRREATLAEFLAPLSCYLHRSETWWKEGSGRELFGAMAMGIPVVCPRASIYAEYLDHDVDGMLYHDGAGALEALAILRDDPGRAAAIGTAARETARRLFDPGTLAAAYRRAIGGAAVEA